MSFVATWALSETASNAVTISKDALRVFSDENIQPIAFFAAERFGATIAMSPQTRKKLEVTLKQTAEPVMVEFLKAQIGYPKQSAVTELSKSLAGVNFLALATALVSTMGWRNWEVGDALEKMITASASDKTLTPTAYQLTALVDRLEPRLARVGFANELLGWEDWCKRCVGVDDTRFRGPSCKYPNAEGIHLIVEAFRGLERVGNTQSVVLHATSCVPWLMAFTKWCLGIEPSFKMPDGQLLLEQPLCRVTVQYQDLAYEQDRVRIETLSTTERLSTFLEAKLAEDDRALRSDFSGMVTVANHGQQWLRRNNLTHNGLGRRALLEALSYAIRPMRSCMIHVEKLGPVEQAVKAALTEESAAWEPLLSFRGCAFPTESTIAEVASIYLSINGFAVKTLPSGTLITDLPLVKLWKEELERNCPQHAQQKGFAVCAWNVFLEDLSDILANIFSLSLLHDSLREISLRINGQEFVAPHTFMQYPTTLKQPISSILFHGEIRFVPVEAILARALHLLGHDVVQDVIEQDWVMSSFHGQAVFPILFESNDLDRVGFLELLCVPGEISFKDRGIRVQTVRSRVQGSGLPARKIDDLDTTIPLTRTLYLYPAADLRWVLSTYGNSTKAYISWTESACRLNPFDVLTELSRALLVRVCSHPANRELDKTPVNCLFTSPLELRHPGVSHAEDRVCVVPTKDNNRLRLFSLAATGTVSGGRCVLVDKACLECAIKICRLAEFDKIIC